MINIKSIADQIVNLLNTSTDNSIIVSLFSVHLSNNCETELFTSHIDFDYLDKSPFFNTIKDATYYTLNEAVIVQLFEDILSIDKNINIETYQVFNFNTFALSAKAPISKSIRRLVKEARIGVFKK